MKLDKKKLLEEFELWSNEKYCLEAVKQDGCSLQYVKDQSEAVCLEAVKQDGCSLQYVKEEKTFIKILEKK